ncbi:SDR family oxidoreductase [Streptomyces sp. NPDC094468]|uniref:SDR family oxidoreductase n=1 Tax=Streptomyces sp. NPDC094468 TaxID=3366066 RepID=UPI0038087C64
MINSTAPDTTGGDKAVDGAGIDKVWLITGVSSGLGLEMTRQLLVRGMRVVGTARNPRLLERLQAEHPGLFQGHLLDVTDATAIYQVIDHAVVGFGGLDVVVNNAGYGLFGAAEEVTGAQIEHQIATNLTGSIHVTRAALPHLRARGGGRIVQVSTYGGHAAYPGGSLYSAGKFGIEGFMEALAKEVAPFKIGVTIVEPGGTRTGFRRGAVFGTPLAAYDGTPAAAVRGLTDDSAPSPGDPQLVAAAIIAAAEADLAPLRVVLGSDSYRHIVSALRERLAGVEDQETSSAMTDRPA